MNLFERRFTLIDLIVVTLVFCFIMMFVIPCVNKWILKSTRVQYINDAKRLVLLTKEKFEESSLVKPVGGDCYVYQLNELGESNMKAPHGGSYVDDYSYVVLSYDETFKNYEFFIQLVEEYFVDGTYYYQGVKNRKTLEVSDGKQKSKKLFFMNKEENIDSRGVLYVTDSFSNMSNNFVDSERAPSSVYHCLAQPKE